MSEMPWLTGPVELLWHAQDHMEHESDFDLRITMVSVDNAVEAAFVAYLEYGINLKSFQWSDYKKKIKHFPGKVDLIEKYGPPEVSPLLADIRYYHDIRNQIYHQGNGLTVEREKVAAYAQLSRTVISQLFHADIDKMIEQKHREETDRRNRTDLKYSSQIQHLVRLGVPIEDFFKNLIESTSQISEKTIPEIQRKMQQFGQNLRSTLGLPPKKR